MKEGTVATAQPNGNTPNKETAVTDAEPSTSKWKGTEPDGESRTYVEESGRQGRTPKKKG